MKLRGIFDIYLLLKMIYACCLSIEAQHKSTEVYVQNDLLRVIGSFFIGNI